MGRISIHALREEGDWQALLDRADSDDFYPRPPRGGRPLFQSVGDSFRQFLSTPSARRATSALYSRPPASKFLSTPSARRATQRADTALDARQNFYPRPPRGGRRDRLLYPHQRRAISIHALREEGDQLPPPHPGRTKYFYPRPPRGGRRTTAVCSQKVSRFLSTPSARRATKYKCRRRHKHQYFYPRPPRGGRLIDQQAEIDSYLISIHALREEGDKKSGYLPRKASHFYPRPPRGGRPRNRNGKTNRSRDFYPRPPRGGRLVASTHNNPLPYFYPRPPRGGRRGWRGLPTSTITNFYPRPPRGGRQHLDCAFFGLCDFYPRPPRGGRQRARQSGKLLVLISIHALREEGDIISEIRKPVYRKFLSTPSARRATAGYIPCGSA